LTARITRLQDVAFIDIIRDLLPAFETLGLGKERIKRPYHPQYSRSRLDRLTNGQFGGITEFLDGNKPSDLKPISTMISLAVIAAITPFETSPSLISFKVLAYNSSLMNVLHS